MKRFKLIAALAAVVALGAASVAIAATITGTPGPDTLNGTAVGDKIDALGGDDTVFATVDGTVDFAAFGNAFGTTVANSPFDFDNNGNIDGTVDFAAFGNRFGVTL